MRLIATRNVTLERDFVQYEIKEGDSFLLVTYYTHVRLVDEHGDDIEISWADMHKIFNEFHPYRGIDDECPSRMPITCIDLDINNVPTWGAIKKWGIKLE